MKITKKTLIHLIISALIIISSIIGSIQTINYGSSSNGNDILYFTVQSNLWLAAIYLIVLILELISFKKNKDIIPSYIHTLKFIFVVSITITFIVFFTILVPEIGSYVITMPGSLLVHLVSPVLAIIDYLIFENKQIRKKQTVIYPLIPPLIYFIVIIILSYNGLTFVNDQKVPYFFLDYERLTWFNISNNKIGVFYWVLILSILILGISYSLLKLNEVIQTKIALKREER